VILPLVAFFVARVPSPVRDLFATTLAFVVGQVVRLRRAHVESALARCDVGDPAGLASALYRGLSGNLFDLLAVAGGRDLGSRSVRLTERARAALLLARGAVSSSPRPVVIAASHTGNWELAAFALARECPVTVVAKRQGVSSVDRYVNEVRSRFGVNVLAPLGAFATASRALSEGQVVVMPIDQVPDRAEHGDVVRFLGANALVDRAPFVLAKRVGATVLVAACEGPNVHVIDVIVPSELGCPRAAARRATLALDVHVRTHPTSWLWLHRRWKNVPRVGVKKCSESRQVA
jgi:Kdo2-lipid IVA lauroyltransferase/acyltransferase